MKMPPALPPEMVQEFVAKAHGDIERVQTLLHQEPALVNAAWSRGLGCVINSQGIMQSPVVRQYAGIPEDQVIMKAVALGWPDPDFPANRVYTNRKSVSEATRFVGFD